MSDIYVPGIKSRLNTDAIVDDLMKIERIPRDRAEKTIEGLQTQKDQWQEIGRRISTLRESARFLFSFQNPFNERIAASSDEQVLSGTASRQAVGQERVFTVKQIARADRFLSGPLDSSFKVDAGTYGFKIGETELSFTFRGGTLKEFTEALNRKGRDKVQASIINIQKGKQSLLIESLVTGADNRLDFEGASGDLAEKTGMAEKASDAKELIQAAPLTVAAGQSTSLKVDPMTRAAQEGMVLSLETSIKASPSPVSPEDSGQAVSGNAGESYGPYAKGQEEDDLPPVPVPVYTPPPSPPPSRVDNLSVLSLTFTDGTTAKLPPLKDSGDWVKNEYKLSSLTGGKTIAAITIENNNTGRDVSLQNVTLYDSSFTGNYRPKNPVSRAQDALIEMDGIEIQRPSNNIDDLIPGVTVTAKSPADYPVRLTIEPDREAVKEAIIAMVGNYNRLAAEINVLTRNDERIINELGYLSPEEQEAMRKKMGAFLGESSLIQFKTTMQQTLGSPYPTVDGQDLALLAQAGIGTGRSGSATGYDASRLRGYIEIDEKALDNAIATRLEALMQLFGNDTDGDLVVDSGAAWALDNMTKPYVETGGLVSLRTGTIDSKITQEQNRIATLDRQLAVKESTLKKQYGQMEGAYTRMERMGQSMDRLGQQGQGNNR